MVDRSVSYSAGLMSEAPWFLEFKKLVQFRKDCVPQAEVMRLCIEENLFGMPKEYRAKRTYGYLVQRLNTMDNTFVDLFCSSDIATQKIINLITVLRQDRLFFEFVNEVYRDKVYLGFRELTAADVNAFFTTKSAQDDQMAEWIDTTFRRLRTAYFQFLEDANLIRKTGRVFEITPPILDIALERYLQVNGEEAILNAITGVK